MKRRKRIGKARQGSEGRKRSRRAGIERRGPDRQRQDRSGGKGGDGLGRKWTGGERRKRNRQEGRGKEGTETEIGARDFRAPQPQQQGTVMHEAHIAAQTPVWVSVRQMSEELGWETSGTLRPYCEKGLVRCERRGNPKTGRWYVDRNHVAQLLREHGGSLSALKKFWVRGGAPSLPELPLTMPADQRNVLERHHAEVRATHRTLTAAESPDPFDLPSLDIGTELLEGLVDMRPPDELTPGYLAVWFKLFERRIKGLEPWLRGIHEYDQKILQRLAEMADLAKASNKLLADLDLLAHMEREERSQKGDPA